MWCATRTVDNASRPLPKQSIFGGNGPILSTAGLRGISIFKSEVAEDRLEYRRGLKRIT